MAKIRIQTRQLLDQCHLGFTNFVEALEVSRVYGGATRKFKHVKKNIMSF